MLNLYIDFDGVIMNTIEVTYKEIEKMGIKREEQDRIFEFYSKLDWKKVLEESEPIHDSFNCIKKIIDSEKFNVSILTHVTSLSEIEEKVKVIRKHFRDITIIPVPKTISKTEMLKAEGAVLVDDYVHNLIEWEKAGGYGIRFDLDMDGKGFPVIDRLDVLIDLLDE